MISPLKAWNVLNAYLPKFVSNFFFTQIVKFMNPYSRSIPFKVALYEKGLCLLEVQEKRGIRNPFSSIHAAALVLLGETAGGLSVMSALNPKERFIVTSITATYHSKARETILATAKVDAAVLSKLRETKAKGNLPMDIEIHQANGKAKLANIKVDFYVDCTKI
eukprot:NODE_117_length_18986_cov_0.639540.p11 type:complete len:164 gc:universal NODE_117_length_18986_cov_0.639540:18052-18543(+)